MKWVLKTFSELTVEEFHNILQLRINVFVVEQNCPYPELDGNDKVAFHFFGVEEDDPVKILAYTRIFKPGVYFKEASIGRVVVHPDYRNDKLGHEMMSRSIQKMEELFNTSKITISAQSYLQKFYEVHGFKRIGEEYLEDDIPHIKMIRN